MRASSPSHLGKSLALAIVLAVTSIGVIIMMSVASGLI